MASGKRAHILRLDAALGADAPLTEDFVTVLPRGAVAMKAKAVALLRQLETLLVRVYLNGVGYATDPATRVFLGRLLTYDSQALGWRRTSVCGGVVQSIRSHGIKTLVRLAGRVV